ncbi:MAG: MaoC/PaaZ C-terminal domain-containing protein [Acidimicrobiales bacterium]
MPNFAQVNVGDELPPVAKTPGRRELVQYAAGSGDFNPLHYDTEFPQAKALGDNIVHGRMKFAVLGELVSNWLAHTGRIKTIACSYRGMDLQGKTLTAKGVVVAKREQDGQKLVDLEIYVENASGTRTTPGTATVILDH